VVPNLFRVSWREIKSLNLYLHNGCKLRNNQCKKSSEQQRGTITKRLICRKGKIQPAQPRVTYFHAYANVALRVCNLRSVRLRPRCTMHALTAIAKYIILTTNQKCTLVKKPNTVTLKLKVQLC
jgi:hypothetical protein